MKVRRRQELVVGGWTGGEGNREGSFGGLLVGHHADGDPGWAARVRRLGRHRLRPGRADAPPGAAEAHASERSPFRTPLPKTIKGIRWTEPALVVEVGFAEWTSEGRMRHPAYLGQRIDADPERVIREPG